MVSKEDEYLKIKVKHNDESKEFKSENLPTLDELKSKIMGYLSIPDIKKYMHFSYRNKEGQNITIENEKDLKKYSNPSQDNESYIEIDLSIENELNKIKQFMNSAQFNSNNYSKIDSDNNYQKLNEKEKNNKSEVKNNEEDKTLKIKELEEQINEIKKRREHKKNIIKEINKIFQNFENIIIKKKELYDLKISNFINEIQNKIINDIMPLIERNISNYLKYKNNKYDGFVTSTKDLINKIELNINNNNKIIYDIYIIQNGESKLKLDNNFEEICKDIDYIKNEINNINKIKAKNDSKEIENNNQNKDNIKRNEIFNNAKDYYTKVYKFGKHEKIQLKKHIKVKSENLSLKNSEQKKDSNEIMDDFNLFLEQLFYDDLKGLRYDEKNKMKDFVYDLKNLGKEPLPIIQYFLDNNISSFDKNIPEKNEKEEKFRNIINLVSKYLKEYDNDNLIEEKKISYKDNSKKIEPKKYKFERKYYNKNK